MNDLLFAPGPWRWAYVGHVAIEIFGEDGRCIASLSGDDEANANLIAAAPALYHALRDAYIAGNLPAELRIAALRALVLAEEGGDR